MKKSELLFIVLSGTLLLFSCKSDPIKNEILYNYFSFENDEEIVHIDESISLFELKGKVLNDNFVNVAINELTEETTAIEGLHYVRPNMFMIFFNQREQTIVFEILPENITEEVQITFETSSYVKIMEGGKGKTVVKLIPVNP